MMHPFRLVAALALPLLLCSCFLIPGKFASTLDIRKDGRFSFTYAGEIIAQTPDELNKKAVWNEQGARCSKSADMEPYYSESGDEIETGEDSQFRKCNAAELAALKKDWTKEQAEKADKDAKEAEQFGQMFGFNSTDDAAMQKFATQLTKQAGWKSATYVGKGKFNVSYALSGRLDHDFVFPVIPDTQMLLPFVTIQRRADGAVQMIAPAYSGATFAGMSGGMAGMMAMGRKEESKDDGQPRRTVGQFTVTTDGEILSNNTTDGPVADAQGRKMVWDVGTLKDTPPRALIMVK